jgi:polyisoprenoid-binding protein YceI
MNGVFVALFAVVSSVASAQAQTPAAQSPQRPVAQAPAPHQWTIDSVHSAATFSVRHMLVTNVRGRLGPISGSIEYDGKDLKSVTADVRVDVKALTTENAKRDDHLRSDDFFDVANHPTITFKSKRVEPGPAGQFKLIGDLTIRGTTREVVLDVEGPSAPVKDQGGMRIGATATTRVKRLEYGLKYNRMVEAGPVVGDDVVITIDLELMRPTMPGTSKP